MELEVINANHKNISQIADCYIKAFPNSFASSLGKEYLCHNLLWFLNDTRRFLFFIPSGDKCAGFCGGYVWLQDGDGSTSSMLTFSNKLRNKILLKRPWLMLNYETLYKVLKFILIKLKIFFIGKILKENGRYRSHPSIGLVVIGLDPDFRGSSFSGILMEAFELKCKSIGISNAHLTVRRSNSRAINYYKKHGWVPSNTNEKFSQTISMNKTILQNQV